MINFIKKILVGRTDEAINTHDKNNDSVTNDHSNDDKNIEASCDTDKDYSLTSGERQVGRELDDIRSDHTNRYYMAVEYIADCKKDASIHIADVFCGNGYGTYIISKNIPGATVIGLDGSEEAILLANECYTQENNYFSHKLFPFKLPISSFDFVTCFESLEHVEEDQKMLNEIISSLKTGGTAFISVPNDEIHSLEKNPHKFHFRHYKHSKFIEMLPPEVKLVKWFGQDVYRFEQDGINTFQLLPMDEMKLVENQFGQVNIYILEKRYNL
ncbi:class I SAM-dependent methyltransferase [Prodigiosinella aquatilis]|nr:class I SAM-dependent methyltransferase [Prodigiosinella sp. LS101]WJV54593.1 class I SAM-dependent methyltransferase [Prodigiosinella sp. LS101]WJV58955.1 class I SAM-dependent methyltransferase [Pectobacteriaceae bacterium C111]